MGNCMQSRVSVETDDPVIKVMRMDGKMLEYSTPLLVRDLLTESGNYQQKYMVVRSDDISHALPYDSKLEGGQLYYLIETQNENFEDGSTVMASSQGAVKGFRLKIVVSKQQLKALLSDDDVEEKLVEQLLMNQLQPRAQQEDSDRRWRPSLEKIPEIN